MTVGLLGGTFDPIHVGHVDMARAARAALALDLVWLVPSRVPPHRRAPHASAAHRFAMAVLAATDDPNLRVSDVEMDASGPSYTADTLDRLAGRGMDLRNICFVIGADAFQDIGTWKDYPRVLDRCTFAVVSRPGLPAPDLRARLPDLAERMRDAPCDIRRSPGIVLVDAPTASVSSTTIRNASRRGDPIDQWVDPRVAAHIRRHRLYSDDHDD